MSYILLALIATLFFSASQLINKFVSKHAITDANSLFVYFLIASFVFGVFLLPFVPLQIPGLQFFLLLLGAGSTFTVGSYCFYKGILTTDVSTIAPLFTLQAGIIAVLAFIFLGERFPVQNYAWMLLLLVGAVLVTVTENMKLSSFLHKGVLFLLTMQLFHATSNIFIGFLLKLATPITIIFWEDMYLGLLALLYMLWKGPRIDYGFKQVAPFFVAGFTSSFGIIAIFAAFAQNLTISSLLGLLNAPIVFVFTLFASKFWPQLLEHHSAKVYAVRALGLFIILTAVVGITLIS